MRTLGIAAHVQEYISTVCGHVYADTHADAGYTSSCTAGYQRCMRTRMQTYEGAINGLKEIKLFLEGGSCLEIKKSIYFSFSTSQRGRIRDLVAGGCTKC